MEEFIARHEDYMPAYVWEAAKYFVQNQKMIQVQLQARQLKVLQVQNNVAQFARPVVASFSLDKGQWQTFTAVSTKTSTKSRFGEAALNCWRTNWTCGRGLWPRREPLRHPLLAHSQQLGL